MPKNIVICCDGVLDGLSDAMTNVQKLYKTLLFDATQVAYYHPGIGSEFTGIGTWWSRVTGLAFASGSYQNVVDAYQFLMRNFEPDDKVFLFGFRRGAYTARGLCGLLHTMGLLRIGNERLIPTTIRVIKQRKVDFAIAARHKTTFARECKPHFVGVWDTVSSVGWIYNPISFPFTRAAANPDLRIVRHAVSIDERRAFFRENLFGEPDNPQQDIKEVWFAGVHSDVGGGYYESESQLSKISLKWMLDEAQAAGLRVDMHRREEILGGKPPYVAPDPATRYQHESLRGGWWEAEAWPKIVNVQDRRGAWHKSIRFNLGRPRRIAPGALIHESVKLRMEAVNYRPSNLPSEYTVVTDRDSGTIPTELRPAVVLDTEIESAVPNVPSELVNDCARRKCVLFVGAGLSAQAGLPTWKEGLTRILQDLAGNPETTDLWQPLLAKVSEGDTETTAQLLAVRLQREELQSRVQRVFASSTNQLPPTHQALQEIRFAFALTYNWDALLEKTFGPRGGPILTPKDSSQFAGLLREGRFFVLKIYGNPSDKQSFLFTTAEYKDSAAENPDYSRFIVSLFSSYSVLFLGASLRGIEDFLSAIRLRGQTARMHYALVPRTPDSMLQAERFKEHYGIKLLFYQPSTKRTEVKIFLEKLAQAVKALPSLTPDLGWAPLTRVELANIGPFTKLEISFDSSWNVLLANNGLGKSTLLKSIALGLCGDHEKAVSAARSLLRVAESSGYIKLWIGQDVYESELVRDGADVKVRSRRYTPLQSGNSVVIGFPPLRGVSLRSIRGVSKLEPQDYPVVEDLLPLITGGVDSRVDNLKQWIVNTATRARTYHFANARYILRNSKKD